MPSLPILRRKHGDDDQRPEEAPSSGYSEGPDENEPDILSLLRIAPQTFIADDVLVAEDASRVQFRTSNPEGYYFGDVEEFHARVVEALKWYVNALHQRDLDVTRLATEVDRTQTDLLNNKYTNEWMMGRGRPVVGDDGEIATYDDGEQLTELQARIEELEESNRSLNYELQVAQQTPRAPEVVSDTPMSSQEREQYAELRTWADHAEVAYVELEAEVEDLKSRLNVAEEALASKVAESEQLSADLQTANNYSSELDAYINTITPLLERLQNGQSGEDEPVVEESQYVEPTQVAEQHSAHEEEDDEEYEESPTFVVSEPETQPVQQYTAEDDDENRDDMHDRMMREIADDSDDVAGFRTAGQTRSSSSRSSKTIQPGAPLRSIPPGADPEDYL